MGNTSIKKIVIDEHILNLFYSKKITIQEMLVLAEIQYLDNNKGCFASNQHFADLLMVKKEQAENHIKSLKKKGLIKVTIKNYNQRVINVSIRTEAVAEQVEEQVPLQQEPAKSKEEKKVVPFSGNKNNTYKPKTKKDKFHSGYSHGFNYGQLEELETQYVANQLDAMHHHELSDRAKELLSQVHIDEEPSEWLGVNQLKI